MTTKYRLQEINGIFYLQRRGWFSWKDVRTAIPCSVPLSMRVSFNDYKEAIEHLKMLHRETLKPEIKYYYIDDVGQVFVENFDRSKVRTDNYEVIV